MPTTQPPWTIANAKARLSEVIERAHREGPQILTKNGRSTAVVVSIEEWERKSARKGSLAEFLLASPLRGADLDLERSLDEDGSPNRELPDRRECDFGDDAAAT